MPKQKLSSKTKISIPLEEYKELIECRDRLLSRVFKDKRFIIMGNIFTQKHLNDIVPEKHFDDFRQYVHNVYCKGWIEGADPEEFYQEFKQEQEEEEEDELKKFKYPKRCRKINGEWKQYLGAGHFCDPETIELCAECETELTEDTHIMCYESHIEKNNCTLCSNCYVDYEYWKTDINEDNEDMIEEWKQAAEGSK